MARLSSIGRFTAQALTVTTLSAGLPISPIQAAEEIFFDFGPFNRAIPVSSLEAFVEDGTVDENLDYYLNLLEPEAQEELRQALGSTREPENALAFSQFLYTPMGERALHYTGQMIQTGAGLNGDKALRSAFILASSNPEGLSLINGIKAFPTEAMRLNIGFIMADTQQVIEEAEKTQALVDTVKQLSEAEATAHPFPDPSPLPDLTKPGPFPITYQKLTLTDTSRDRTFPVDLFLPTDLTQFEAPIPVVVISHGLGDTRISFRDIASHVASHGFAVAVPEHIGSNAAQKAAMQAWLSDETFLASEFLDRPLDISYVLDELERKNASEFQNHLNVNQVTVTGHSFGGYTAFMTAGATIDFERLEQRCDPEAAIVVDAALLLECRALELLEQPEVVQKLGVDGVQDDRVKLIMAFAPVTNLLGERGVSRVQIPVMILGGANDIVAPVVPQQLDAFTWLTTDEKYFYLNESSSHSPGVTRAVSRLFYFDQDFEQGVEEGLSLSREISKSLVVAFSQVYLANRSEYSPFLTSGYIETVSEEPFKIHMVRELSLETP